MDASSTPPNVSLQVGLMLDALPTKVPVQLRPEGLAAHTAIIAQSGSGKSFMLGRLLEELVGKTKARLLILDPNSDFATFQAVDEASWEHQERKPFFTIEDTLSAFKQRWGGVGFSVLT